MAVGFVLLPNIILHQTNGLFLPYIADYGPAVFWSVDVAYWVLLPVGLLYFLFKTKLISPASYGLGLQGVNWLVVGVLSALIFLITAIVYYPAHCLALHYFGEPSSPFTYPAQYPDGPMWYVVWIYSALTAGFIESILYLGLPWLLYSSQSKFKSRVLFILVVSTVFAMAHWEKGAHAIASSLAYHLVICVWFFRLRNLWAIAIGHTVFDLVAFSALGGQLSEIFCERLLMGECI